MKLAIMLAVAAAPSSKGWWESTKESIRDVLGPVLKPLHAPLDAWLGSLPMWVAMACAIGLFVVAGIWVWCLPRAFVYRGAPDNRWWRDLRIWATVVLLPYIGIYLLLGR